MNTKRVTNHGLEYSGDHHEYPDCQVGAGERQQEPRVRSLTELLLGQKDNQSGNIANDGEDDDDPHEGNTRGRHVNKDSSYASLLSCVEVRITKAIIILIRATAVS